jgi:hypothetical protein
MMNKLRQGIAYVLAVIVCVALASDCWAQVPEAIGGKVPTLAPLVREVTPSVVNISVQRRAGAVLGSGRSWFLLGVESPGPPLRVGSRRMGLESPTMNQDRHRARAPRDEHQKQTPVYGHASILGDISNAR